MGAEAYTWVTKYRKNLADALEAARAEVFAAGKFIGAEEHPGTIEDAVAIENETGSLLDIVGVSEAPECFSVCWLSKDELIEFFGTVRPEFAEIVKSVSFWESFDSGEARAVVLYENGKPATICFAGWTFDDPAVSGSFEDVKGKEKTKAKATKPETVFGLWVNPIGPPNDAFPCVLEMSYNLMDFWSLHNPTDREIFDAGLGGYRGTPVLVKCVALKTALNRLLAGTSNGYYRYSVKDKDDAAGGGVRGMSVPLLDEPMNLRQADFAGGVCHCWMIMRYLEREMTGPWRDYKTLYEEITDISGQKEIQLGNKTILIIKKKISPLFEREKVTAVVAALSGYSDDHEIEIMLGDIQVINGKLVISSDSPWSK